MSRKMHRTRIMTIRIDNVIMQTKPICLVLFVGLNLFLKLKYLWQSIIKVENHQESPSIFKYFFFIICIKV